MAMFNQSRTGWAKSALPPLILILGTSSAWTLGSTHWMPAAARAPCSPQVDITAVITKDPDAIRINREIDSIFAAAIAEVTSSPATSRYERLTLLGKLLLHDRSLSVNRNVACVTCHSAETGHTGADELFNRTIVAYPGSSDNLV